MNSEKVKEIKQALENCQKDNCLGCPYFINKKRCRANDLLLDTITLINELESENERIKNIGLNEDITVREWLQENKQLKDRIAELEEEIKENAFYAKGYAQGIKKTYEVVIPENLTQFAERLKDKLEEYRLENEYFIKDEPNGNLWQLNASVFCIEVTQDGGLVDETLKEFLK